MNKTTLSQFFLIIKKKQRTIVLYSKIIDIQNLLYCAPWFCKAAGVFSKKPYNPNELACCYARHIVINSFAPYPNRLFECLKTITK